MAPEPFFLPVEGSRRFCIFHPSFAGTVRAAVLFLHPFAEEMNKSRRMAALQARQLAANGFAVLQIDLHGCGDSSGDFADANWENWLQDVCAATVWLHERCAAPLWLWGLRSGCLLAAEVARRLAEPAHLLFWQPPPNGRLLLQQFLRLKAAAGLLTGEGTGVMEDLRQRLAADETVEIAGYALSPALARGLEAARLAPPTRAGRLVWLEVSSREDPTLSPASAKALDEWRNAGWTPRAQAISGPAFWQTTEIETAPALLAATLAALETSP